MMRKCTWSDANRGAVLVELAAILPFILILSLATVEFASALVAYKRLANQTYVAARWLSTQAPGQGHVTAACMVKYGEQSSALPCTGTLLLPNLASATVTITDASTNAPTHRAQMSGSTDGVAINLVTVTLSDYRHTLLFGGFLKPITGGAASIGFTPISTTMRQIS